MDAAETLMLSDTDFIVYHRLRAYGDGANRPGIIFLSGFRSDMSGNKAVSLEKWARAHGRAYVRFDYRGHGLSSGVFTELAIGDWASDAARILEMVNGPQILVGSSMGGWIALLLAQRCPERIAGLIGVAAAPDFTEDLMWANLSDATRRALLEHGQINLPSEYDNDPYPITRKLIENGRENLVLGSTMSMAFPVRLLHGTADKDVPVSVALRIMEQSDCQDVRVTLVKDADHRFSGPRELALIAATLEEID